MPNIQYTLPRSHLRETYRLKSAHICLKRLTLKCLHRWQHYTIILLIIWHEFAMTSRHHVILHIDKGRMDTSTVRYHKKRVEGYEVSGRGVASTTPPPFPSLVLWYYYKHTSLVFNFIPNFNFFFQFTLLFNYRYKFYFRILSTRNLHIYIHNLGITKLHCSDISESLFTRKSSI